MSFEVAVDPIPSPSPHVLPNNLALDMFLHHFSQMDVSSRQHIQEVLGIPEGGDPYEFYLGFDNQCNPHFFLRVCFLLVQESPPALEAWASIYRFGFDTKLHRGRIGCREFVDVIVEQRRPGYTIAMEVRLMHSHEVCDPPRWLARDPLLVPEVDTAFDSKLDDSGHYLSGTPGSIPVDIPEDIQDFTSDVIDGRAPIPPGRLPARRAISNLSNLSFSRLFDFPNPGLLSDSNSNTSQTLSDPNYDNTSIVAPGSHQHPSINRANSFASQWSGDVAGSSNHHLHGVQDSDGQEGITDDARSSSAATAGTLSREPTLETEEQVPTVPNSPVLQATPIGTIGVVHALLNSEEPPRAPPASLVPHAPALATFARRKGLQYYDSTAAVLAADERKTTAARNGRVASRNNSTVLSEVTRRLEPSASALEVEHRYLGPISEESRSLNIPPDHPEDGPPTEMGMDVDVRA